MLTSVCALNLFGAHAQSGAPANDNFAAAQEIVFTADELNGTAGSVTQNNTDATLEEGEPFATEHSGGASIWYRWQAQYTGRVRFDTYGSEVSDTILGVYTGAQVDQLEEIGYSDDDGGEDNYAQSRVSFAATEGTTYYIAVDGYSGATGELKLNYQRIITPPTRPLDDFAGAVELTSASGSVSATTDGATREDGEPDHYEAYGTASVWYKWTAQEDGQETFNIAASDFDAVLAVYTGDDVAQLDEVDSSGYGTESSVTFSTYAGTTYYIAVDGYDGATGAFTLNYQPYVQPPPPANDNFADAQTVSGFDGTEYANNEFATAEEGEPNHAGTGGGVSIWYRFTPTTSGGIQFDTLGTPPGVDTKLAVYTGASVDQLTEVASNNDAGGGTFNSRVIFEAQAGTTYYIAVDCGYANGGDIVLRRQAYAIPYPANDDFVNAQSLPVAPQPVSGTNAFATAQAGEPNHAGEAARNSVWYSYQATTTGGIFFSVSSGGASPAFSPRIAVYTGTSITALTPVAAKAGDVSPGFNGSATTGFQAQAGTTYYIAVDGQKTGRFGNYSNTSGTFTLTYNSDTTAPVSSVTNTPPASGYYRGAGVGVGIFANDGQNSSGVRSITYRASGAQTIAQTTVNGGFASFNITAEGATTINFYATDNAGNVEAEKTYVVKIDRTAPAVAATQTPAPANGFTKGNATVTLTANDTFSGAASITYSTSGAQTTSATTVNNTGTGNSFAANVSVTAEGTTTVTYTATDRAGNTSQSGSYTLTVDKTAPTSSFSVQRNGNQFEVTVNAADNLSGVQAVKYSVNGCAEQTVTSFTNGQAKFVYADRCTRSGQNTARYYAIDKAGNMETAKTVTFTVPPQAVTPILECVTRNSNGTYTARFGYQNSNPFVVTIPVGNDNKFTPTPNQRGQVTTFQPGRVTNAFTVNFTSNTTLVWYLRGLDGRGRSVNASRTSTLCR